MSRVVDVASVALLIASAGAFVVAIHALGQRNDLRALAMLACGGFSLRGAWALFRGPGADG